MLDVNCWGAGLEQELNHSWVAEVVCELAVGACDVELPAELFGFEVDVFA